MTLHFSSSVSLAVNNITCHNPPPKHCLRCQGFLTESPLKPVQLTKATKASNPLKPCWGNVSFGIHCLQIPTMDPKSSHQQISPFSLSLRHTSIGAGLQNNGRNRHMAEFKTVSLLHPGPLSMSCSWVLWFSFPLGKVFPANRFLVDHP